MIERRQHATGVLELVIQRPPVNAFDIGLLHLLAAQLEAAGKEDIGAVLLRAEGRGFCAGGDLKEMEALPGFEGILGQAKAQFAASLAVMKCELPVICAVHNYCVGAGVLVAAAADILVAAPKTRFILAEIDNGATGGGVQALRLIPEKRLRAAMMTAEPVLAEELAGFGTLYRIIPPEQLAEASLDVAARVAAKPREVMRRLKRSLNDSTKVAEIEALYRAELSYSYELNMLGEASRSRSAFLEGERKSYMAEGAGSATAIVQGVDKEKNMQTASLPGRPV